MIKKSTYIRSFTALQQKQLEKVQKEQDMKTVPEILFFALDKYLEQKADIERLNRIIQLKQNKIEITEEKLEYVKTIAKKVHELSTFFKDLKPSKK